MLEEKELRLRKTEYKERISPEALKLEDTEETTKEIISSIREQIKALGMKGAVIGVSGGLDSAVALYLVTRAIGPENVRVLIMPDKHSDRQSEEDAMELAVKAGVQDIVKIDITSILKGEGAYKLLPIRLIPFQKLKKKIIQWIFKRFKKKYRKVELIPSTTYPVQSKFVRRGQTLTKLKHQARWRILREHSQNSDSASIGAANKTEALTGFFVPGGIDDSRLVDIAPLQGLFKTQVREIGKVLSIPERILKKPPSPDILPGINDEDFLGSYEKIDLILHGFEKGIDCEEISQQLDCNIQEVKEVSDLFENSRRLHTELA